MSLADYSKAGCCVGELDAELCLCAGTDIVDLVSRKWTLPVMWLLGKYGSLRFKDISRRLNNANSNTLSIRLDELERAGLVARQKFNEIPPRVEYSLTEEGRRLEELTKPLLRLTLRDRAAFAVRAKFVAKKA